MAKEPDSLVLQHLREMRGEITALRESAEEHSELFKALRKDTRDWQETTATTAVFAMHANILGQSMESEIADLKKRVEKLEKAK
jgi:NTP pyrophosphatase (non-canonical NTP hydrolase)